MRSVRTCLGSGRTSVARSSATVTKRNRKSRRRKRRQQDLRELRRRQGQSERARSVTFRQPPFGESVPGPLRQQQIVREASYSEQYSGPLPPPKLLKEFEEAIPGSAAKILDNWRHEGEHRRQLERAESDAARGAL